MTYALCRLIIVCLVVAKYSRYDFGYSYYVELRERGVLGPLMNSGELHWSFDLGQHTRSHEFSPFYVCPLSFEYIPKQSIGIFIHLHRLCLLVLFCCWPNTGINYKKYRQSVLHMVHKYI